MMRSSTLQFAILCASAIGVGPGVSTVPALQAQERAEQAPSRDLLLAAAREIMAASRFCALITLDATGYPRARTMDPFLPDSAMVVWFGTSRRTRKVNEIASDARVTLYDQAPDGGGYVSLHGTARLVDDPTEKARRWKEEWAQFYPDREASYLLIEVIPSRIEVISYRHGITGDPRTWMPATVEFPTAPSAP